MMIHKILPILTLVALAALLASDAEAAPLGPEVAVMEIRIGKEREPRRVVLGLYDTTAPLTVQNFKDLIDRGYYKGMRFHRAFPDTLVQTGDPNSKRGPGDYTGTGGPGYTLPAEIREKHKTGAIAMARIPGKINPTKASNGSQFYICLTPMPNLDGEYTVFGEVLEGMETLREISNFRTDSNDFPLEKIVIRSIKIEPRIQEAP